jgi:energy-coupling factor transporter transmembrane protein EcfT
MKKEEKPQGSNAWKIIGFILGIIAILTSLVPVVGIIIAIPGIIISIVAIKKSEKKGLASAALVLNIIALFVGLFVLLLLGGLSYLLHISGYTGPVTEENATNYKMGEKVSFENISITVQSAEKSKQLKNSQNQIIPLETAGFFVSVKIIIENGYASTTTLGANPFVVIDSQRRTFGALTKADEYYTNSITSDTQVQPGVPYSGIKIFEVPENSTGLKLSFKGQVGNSVKMAHVSLEK